MDNIEGVAEQSHVGLRRRVEVDKRHLDNWRWIDDTAVALAEAAGAGGNGLLTDSQLVATGAK